MNSNGTLPFRERLSHWIEHLTHVLPAQAPIRDFVHHNTLHGFQHLPFAEALAAAQRLTGAAVYLPEGRFRELLAQGRITVDDLDAALADAGLADLDLPVWRAVSRRDVLTASLRLAPEDPGEVRRDWEAREHPQPEKAILGLFSASTAPGTKHPWGAAGAGEMPADWREQAAQRWSVLCDRVGREWTLRSLLEHLTGVDVLERVRTVLQRHLAAHLDLGLAAWRNPQRERGFWAAWRACAGRDLAWELENLPQLRDELTWLPEDPVDVLAAELPQVIADESLWPGYLGRLALEMPGWSGMFLWRDRNPGRGDGTPVAMADYLAVRVLLERLLCDDLMQRLTGSALSFSELGAWFAAHPAEFYVRDALRSQALNEDHQNRAARLCRIDLAGASDPAEWQALATEIAASGTLPAVSAKARAARLAALLTLLGIAASDVAGLTAEDGQALLDCAASLDPLARGQIWLLAYERHYREQILAALAANQNRRKRLVAPTAQVIFCMDDREEGTRRHLEEIAPAVATFGAAGFFGVAMYWQGVDDTAPSALCPIVVEPVHAVRETCAPGSEEALARRAGRRRRRLQWRERLIQGTRRGPLAGPLLTALAAPPALAALVAGTLAPGWFGQTLGRWREQFDGRVRTRLQLTAANASPQATPDNPQSGFTDDEQALRVENFLRMIGLVGDFAPLVLVLGHGSGSRNNPHLSAYDCGACSGRHGGPNARALAAMANRPEVRARLAGHGLHIPMATWFIAAEHNTCDDAIAWYDLDLLPGARQADLDRLVGQLAEACRAHAAERCRRLASAPPHPTPWQGRQHVAARSHDIAQARPELGHATNAAAFIGRRDMSRGLFLDRRVFLISYDPVGAGISLEYYFSTVDSERFGCASKVTHNIAGLFGVMEGADSDLRTGLPWQMVEIHEAMRLLVVVEQTPEMLSAIVARQPALQELIGNAWIIVAAQHPETGTLARYCPRRGWLPWSGSAVLPQVGRSADWFAGRHEALAPAIVLGGVA